jgi:hypothetical protein
MEWLWLLLAGLALVAGLGWLLGRARPSRRRCPNCRSLAVGQIAKEPQDLRSVDMHTGGVGGGYSGIQTFFKITYQCNDCRFRWTDTVTETT